MLFEILGLIYHFISVCELKRTFGRTHTHIRTFDRVCRTSDSGKQTVRVRVPINNVRCRIIKTYAYRF